MQRCRSTSIARSAIPKHTPEPFAASARRATPLRFVVQRHAARSLHYDFRLERDGALLSWAVPKGVPMAVGERHLAVHVEDHPLDYGDFEGEIPAGTMGGHGRDLGPGHRRGRRAEEGRRPDRSAPRQPPQRHLDAGARPPRRQRAELAAPPQGRREEARLRADARDRDRRAAEGAGWAFEPKWDGFSALARSPAGTRPSTAETTTTSPPALTVARAVGLAAHLPPRSSTERSAPSTIWPLAVRPAPAGGRHGRLRRVDCSRWTAGCSRPHVRERRTRWRRCSNLRPGVLFSPAFDDGALLEAPGATRAGRGRRQAP